MLGSNWNTESTGLAGGMCLAFNKTLSQAILAKKQNKKPTWQVPWGQWISVWVLCFV